MVAESFEGQPLWRTARDALGEVRVPMDALYGAQTQRAIENFPLSGWRMPDEFVRILARLKGAAALTNASLGRLNPAVAEAIAAAAETIAAGAHADQFPIDVFQTGSGTSSNMNMNEVLGTLAGRQFEGTVHPNDHVNLGQSSNDVIPSALRLSAALAVTERLLPALAGIEGTLSRRADELATVVKTGRTHWMDAMPLTFGQELSGWGAMFATGRGRLERELPELCAIPLGGTAVGTGVNGHPAFGEAVCARLASTTGLPASTLDSPYEGMAGQDAPLQLSAGLRALAVVTHKVANDLRVMSSGPYAGLGEIRLVALQPGSSIMPGKVNPVTCEAVAMACARVIGNDHTVALAAQESPFQLNMMLPLIAHTLIESVHLLSRALHLLDVQVLATFQPQRDRLREMLSRNPIVATALVPSIGYDATAAIVKRAIAEDRPIREVALEATGLDAEKLDELLDPLRLTRVGDGG